MTMWWLVSTSRCRSVGGANQRRPETPAGRRARRPRRVRRRTGADPLLDDVASDPPPSSTYRHAAAGSAGTICTGSSNSSTEPGGQVGMAVDHRVHRVAQPLLIKSPAHLDFQLHRVHVVADLRGAGVEEQPLLQRGQRQDVGNSVPPVQLVDLLLAQPRRRDVRRRQPAPAARTCAQMPVSASNHSRLSRSTSSRSSGRGRPRPSGVQAGADFGVHGARVELHGVRQRHRHRRRRAGERRRPPGRSATGRRSCGGRRRAGPGS